MRVGFLLAAGLVLASCTPVRPAATALTAPGGALPVSRAELLARERQRSAGIRTMRAEPALARADGRGVDVAVIDTGIDATHREFAGRIHPASRDVVGGSLLGPNWHGTHIAGIIAAARDGRSMSGIAPRARLLALRADARDAGCPGGGCYFRDEDLARAVDAATAAGAEVINLSLSKNTPLSAELTAALRRAARSGALIVAAAGNGDSTAVSWPARLAAEKGFAGRLLAVGAVDRQGRPWAYSNRPGETALATHFVTALGVDVLSTVPGGFGRASGTSMAAAHVSGAAALLKSLFPELSMARIGRLLRETAHDLGEAGIDPVFGAGSIDLAAAIAPRGALRTASGLDLAGASFSAGPAFGDGPGRALGQRITARDSLGRAYGLDMGAAIAAAAPADPIAAWLSPPDGEARGSRLNGIGVHALSDGAGEAKAWRLDGDAASLGWSLSRGLGVPSADPQPFLHGNDVASLVGAATSLTFTAALDDRTDLQLLGANGDQRQLLRVALDHRWDRLAAGLTLDRLDEADGPLGSTGGGALELGTAVSHLVGAGLRWWLAEAVEMNLHGVLGITDVEDGGGLADLGTMASTAWAAGAVLHGALVEGDRLGLRLLQPLRVETARARLDGRSLDLAPSGREIDLELAWRAGIDGSTDVAVSLLLAHQAGHDGGRDLDGGLGLRLGRRF